MQNRPFFRAATAVCLLYAVSTQIGAHAEFAATVIDYRPGDAATLTNPYAAVGQPGEIVAAGTGFASIASVFNPHYEVHHLTQIGEGGELILRLDSTVTATKGAPEIALFTNVGLIDGSFPNGEAVGFFGVDQVTVDVSKDGASWTSLGTVECDFPSSAFTDPTSPYQPNADGLTPSDYGKHHSLQAGNLIGMNHQEVLNELGGSAGGTWIDIDPAGLPQVGYLRLRVEDDGDAETQLTFELAGIAINSSTSQPAVEPFRFEEDFSTNPLGTRATSGSGHATYSTGSLGVEFDLASPPARTTWPLGQILTDATSFHYNVAFSITSIDFDTSSFGQISFGLINLATTGSNRTTSPSNCWDLVTVDYFPNPDFSTFTPTVIGSQNPGQTDAFSNLTFPSGAASLINGPGEIGQLPTNTQLSASVEYDAPTRILTLRLDGQPINASGPNPDGDETTIQHTLPEGINFNVDAFSILCWQDSSGGSAILNIDRIEVSTPSPPANYYSWADASISEPIDRATTSSALPNGQNNLLNYALGNTRPSITVDRRNLDITWQQIVSRADVTIDAEFTTDLRTWTPLSASKIGGGPGTEVRRARTTSNVERKLVRLKATRP